jgi:hypothetical protein
MIDCLQDPVGELLWLGRNRFQSERSPRTAIFACAAGDGKDGLVNPLPPGDEEFVDVPPANPSPGDQLLLVERQLLHPKSGKLVGRFNARLTFMRISGGGVLFSGNADHQLKKGVICTQGSFRSDETDD